MLKILKHTYFGGLSICKISPEGILQNNIFTLAAIIFTFILAVICSAIK